MTDKLHLGGDRLVTDDEARAGARAAFLDAVARLEPRVVRDLDALPRPATEQALTAWADRWRLNAPWAVAVGRATVIARRAYLVPGATAPEAAWFDVDVLGGLAGWTPPPLPTFDPRRESRAAYLARIDTELGRRERSARADGRRPAPVRDPSQFDWLARYQVGGETYARIAATLPGRSVGGPDLVRKAIRRLARFIDLPLRSRL